MKIEELTLGQIREISSLFRHAPKMDENSHPYELGKNYFIRTVTHHYTGMLIDVFERELVLKGAAWIADDGRFTNALATETFSEVEMYPNRPVIIGRGAILDAVEITKIPTSQK